VAVVLALLAAVAYGVGDFVGGLASRQRTALAILRYSYPVGAVLMVALLPLFPGRLDLRVVGFGVLGGIAGMIGVALLYGLMTVAPMNVVSPITAVLSAAVPVAFGVLTGDRPSALAWLGVAIGLAAVILVSKTGPDHPHGPVSARVLLLAVLSGIGFGTYFVLLARAGTGTGAWPVVISRITAAVLVVPLAVMRRAALPIRGRLLLLCAVAGGLDAGANLLFLLASRAGLLSLVGAIAALYPAATVVLAMTLLHEHASRAQRFGLALAAGAIVLVTR
jgi:drug/metabolite transporter (DMT)-like permease